MVRRIDIWTLSIAPQYTFPLWKCMIRLRICAHFSLCNIRCFGINMTPMWHKCIFICFIYVMWFFTWTSALSILDFIFEFYKYLSRQDSNNEHIILAEMQYSQPHMTLYRSEIYFNCGGNSERNVYSLIIILSSSCIASLRPP